MDVVYVHMDYKGLFAWMAGKAGRSIARRAQREVLTTANRAGMEYWDTLLPRHFDRDARWRYHYKQRKRPYRRIKKALARGEKVFINGQELPAEKIKKGGEIDIVRGGKVETRVEKQGPIFASSARATLKKRVPRHVVAKSFNNQPRLQTEIRRTTRQERADIRKHWSRQLIRAIKLNGKNMFVRKPFGR